MGALWLAPIVDPAFRWFTSALGFIPLFADYQPPAKNILTASIVLAVMILPIITAVAREVFLQTPAFMKKQPLRLVQHGGKSSRWPCSPLAAPG